MSSQVRRGCPRLLRHRCQKRALIARFSRGLIAAHTGRSQAVRLPPECRLDEKAVYIRRDPATGDVILSRRPASWEGFFARDGTAPVPADFMKATDRKQGEHEPRDPFGDVAPE